MKNSLMIPLTGVLSLLMLISVVVVRAAPSTPSTRVTVPPAVSAAAEAEINAVLDQQTADWNRADTVAFMNGYHKSPDTEFVGAGGIKHGWDAVLERYKHSYPDAAAMGHLTFSNQTIHVLDPQAAYVVGEFHLVRKTGNASGVYTLIMRKFPEGWRIVHDHSTAYPQASNTK